MRPMMKRALLSVTLLALFMAVPLAFAQEAAEAAEAVSEAYESSTTIVLLLGLAALGAISVVWYGRERNAPNGDEQ